MYFTNYIQVEFLHFFGGVLSPSGAIQEGAQHPEQAHASEVQPVDEAGDGPDHRHGRTTEGSD